MIRLFTTGFLQVMLVAINTFLISNNHYKSAVAVSFAISWVWASNVKRIAFGNNLDRLCYAFGAAVGCAAGLLTAKLLYR